MPLTGISEKYSSFKSWDTFYNERTIHNHYFNTYLSEKTISYNRFYIIYSNRNILVERELIYNERTLSFKSFQTINSNKNISLKYIDRQYTYRNISKPDAIPPITTEYTNERTINTSSFDISYDNRNIFIEIFYCTERKLYTIPKNPVFKVDQRFCLMYMDNIQFNERYISYNKYSASFNFNINDNINNISDIIINDYEYNLYDKIIYPESLITEFNLVGVNITSYSTNDFFIIYKDIDNIYKSINIAAKVRNKINFSINTDDYLLDGFILYLSSPIYVRFGYMLRKYLLEEDNLTEEDILYKINRQNLMIIKINNKELDINDLELLYDPPYQLYKLYLYIEKSLKKYIKYIIIDWYYPFKKNTKHNTSLIKIK